MKTRSQLHWPRAVWFLAVALLSLSASAATLTWTGGNGEWTDSTKWSPPQVPGSEDVAVIDGSVPCTILLINATPFASGRSLGELVMQNPNATLRIVAGGARMGLTVNKGFENYGTIELSSELPDLVSQLTVSNGGLTNAVSGTLRASAGMGGSRVIQADLDNRGTLDIAALTDLQRRTGDAVHSNSGEVVVRQK